MGESWADFYQNVCGSVGKLQGNILAHAAFVEEVARLLSPGMRVLEVGSGTGVLGWPIAQAGVKVVSLDNDQGILDMAKINARVLGADIEYVFGDAFHLPYTDGDFDVVFSEGLLEHYSDEEIKALVLEHKRVGRVVVVSVPLKGCKDPAFGNERWLSIEGWVKRLRPLGLIKSFPYGFATRGCFTLVGGHGKT